VLALAYAVALLHAAVVVLVVTGTLFALKWPRLLLLQIPVALVVLGLFVTGSDCPLTDLELWLREQAGAPGYTGGFIGHYMTEPFGQPITATTTQVIVISIGLVPNVVGYTLLARRARQERRRVSS
jgi:hypothetical protein